MRISKERLRENRDRVLGAAADLFREKGFDGAGVAELMRAAGMTHGGFYNHFDSKEEIEAEACGRVFDGAVKRLDAIAAIDGAEARREAFEAYKRRYLSLASRDAIAPSCPMIAFTGEIPRRPEPTRAAYAAGLAAYLDAFARASGRDPSDPAALAAAMRDYATLAGTALLARAVAKVDPALSEALLAAAAF